ncbi:hypothetical protein ACH5RR_016336 [Cinchona calisaya]|uniref:Gag1-like clamp domain-containing protein n=1 Tax=Cinchona calisaya TaxID=153742 RepID=A0ABD2ZZB8_9GENT
MQEMDVKAGNNHFHEKEPFEVLILTNEAKKPVENDSKTPPVFVNNAAIAWHESRKKWTGDPHQKSKKIEKDPIISWSMTYEDLLSTNDPFPERIPLPEMVDFLVDIWHEEGLFD